MLAMGGYNGGGVLEENTQIQTNILHQDEALDTLSKLDDSLQIPVMDKDGKSLGGHTINNILLHGIENLLIEATSNLVITNGVITSGEVTVYIKKDEKKSPNNVIIQKGLDISQHLDTVVGLGIVKVKIRDIINLPDLHYSLNTQGVIQVQHITKRQTEELLNNQE